MAVLPLKVWNGTSWDFVGSAYGAAFIYSPDAPSTPGVGDLWFDTTNNIIRVYTGSVFQAIPGITYTATAPTNVATGTLWFDTTNNVIRVWNGTAWQFIPATSYSASAPTNPTLGSLWVNSNSKELFIWTGSAWVSTGGGASKSNIMFLAGM